jgi:AcrR family transcriptional regulator
LNERSSKREDGAVPAPASTSSTSAGAPSTRDRIIDTALQRFSERGTSAVSMRELAEAAGVTVPGLYYHFDSKADLVRAVYAARGGGLDTPFEPPVSSTVESRIVEQAGREFARLVDDAEFLRLMHREAVLGDVDALEVGGALAEVWRSRWEAVLAGASDVRPDADLRAAADVIATFLWGLFVEYLTRHDATVGGRIEEFADLVAPTLRSPR